jgi:hypothetical protein
MFSSQAVKTGIQWAATTQNVRDLVGDDPRFDATWRVVASVPGWFSQVYAAAMFVVLRDIRPARVVEIGSYLGRSSVFFGKVVQMFDGDEVVAIDPHTGDRQQTETLGVTTMPSLGLFQSHIQACDVEAIVHPIVSPSHDAAAGWSDPIDFLFIDGWHSYDAVLQDGRDWLPHLVEGGAVFFDDYSRHEEVRRGVHELAAEGLFSLWGNSFGQAIGGRGEPGTGAQRVLKVAGRPLNRRLNRPR